LKDSKRGGDHAQKKRVRTGGVECEDTITRILKRISLSGGHTKKGGGSEQDGPRT